MGALVAPSVQAQEAPAEQESEEIVVQATRSGRRVQDDPIRVEVIDQEEIEEKQMMTPGNIAMLVAETGGVRVQVTSPALGAANIRVQGMEGRYTQLLADGLPLYGQASSLGLLQIPPTDLGRVEVIKGAASAFYGPSALGGVINLVSKRPGSGPESDFLVNATTRNGQDFTAYNSAPISDTLGYSVVGGYSRQSRQDIDGDGWADMPAYDRWTVRPRLFWEGAEGARAFLTVGAMTENRTGGTLPGRTTPDGNPFPQNQDTRRFDAGLVAEMPIADTITAHLRASGMTQNHDHLFGASVEDDRHGTLFGEASLAEKLDRTTWLAGLAVQKDTYRSKILPAFNYTYTVPAAFVQLEHDLSRDLTLAGSARFDDHSEYGSRLSPRVSVLYRPDRWTIRGSIGRGFYAPTPFVDEIEAAGLSRLEPLRGLTAETAETASIDVKRVFGSLEANVTLFGSNISNAVRLQASGPDRVRLVNVDGRTRTRGTELLLRYKLQELTFTGSYVYVDATEPADSGIGRQRVERTPRDTAGLVTMWEKHGWGRLGFEAYYTGLQRLEDNPYRSKSRAYVELGLMGEITLGKFSLFVNAENLLDVRQTKYDPLLLPSRAIDGRSTVDVWGPIEGRVINGGIRLRLGAD